MGRGKTLLRAFSKWPTSEDKGTTASPWSGTSRACPTAPHTLSPPRWSLLQSLLPSQTVTGHDRGPTTLTRKNKGTLWNCMSPRQVQSLLKRTQGDRTGSPQGRGPAGAAALLPWDSAGGVLYLTQVPATFTGAQDSR